MRAEVERFRGRFLRPATGLPIGASFDGPARAIQCAIAIIERDRSARAGVHTGECAVVGESVEGVAVELAREVFASASAGEALVSRTVVDLVAGSGLTFENRGTQRFAAVAGEWQLAAVSQRDVSGRPASSPAGAGAGGSFRREGEVWLVEFGGVRVRLRPSRGLEHLVRLLAEPGREFHALELAGGRGGGFDESGVGPILDEPAKRAYRARLQELRERVDEAEAIGDAAAASQAKTELDVLARELAAALGLGGRDRLAHSAAERARVSVAKAIHTAIERIGVQHPRLGEHFAAAIRTGTFCSYQPLVATEWDTTERLPS